MSLLSRIAAVGIMTVAVAASQVRAADVIVKAGVQTQVLHSYDCAQPNHAPVVWARADHGAITIKPVTLSDCGRPSISESGIYYKSEPGFKGMDKLYLLGFITNGKLDSTYSILVK